MKFGNVKSYLRLTGLVLLVYLLWTCKPVEALRHVAGLHPRYWLLVASMVLTVFLLKALRWRWLLAAQRITGLEWWRLVVIYMASVFWGMITPGHVGELSKIGYLSRFGHRVERTLLNSLLDRLFDVAVLVLYGAVGLAFFVRNKPDGPKLDIGWAANGWLVTAVLVAVGAAIAAVWWIRPGWVDRIRSLALATFAELRAARRRFYLLAACVTLVTWGLQLEVYAAIGRGLRLDVPHVYLLAVIPAATFAAMLPITIAGLGIREGTLVVFLGLAGVQRDLALAFAATFIIVNLMNLAVGFVGWLLVGRVLPQTDAHVGALAECPACQTETPCAHLARYSQYQALKCRKCGLAYVQDGRQPAQVEARYDHDIYQDYLVPVDDVESKVADDLTRYFRTLAEPHVPLPARILDVGCGKGHFLARLDHDRYERYGLEPAAPLARYATEHFGLQHVRATTLHAAGLQPDSFDAVSLWMVIEHVPQPAALIDDVRRVLKPGGVVIISTPNFQSLFTSVARALAWLSLGRIKRPLARFLNTSHILGFSPHSLGGLLERQGFEIVGLLKDERYITRYGLAGFALPARVLLKSATRIARMVGRQEAFVVCARKR